MTVCQSYLEPGEHLQPSETCQRCGYPKYQHGTPIPTVHRIPGRLCEEYGPPPRPSVAKRGSRIPVARGRRRWQSLDVPRHLRSPLAEAEPSGLTESNQGFRAHRGGIWLEVSKSTGLRLSTAHSLWDVASSPS